MKKKKKFSKTVLKLFTFTLLSISINYSLGGVTFSFSTNTNTGSTADAGTKNETDTKVNIEKAEQPDNSQIQTQSTVTCKTHQSTEPIPAAPSPNEDMKVELTRKKSDEVPIKSVVDNTAKEESGGEESFIDEPADEDSLEGVQEIQYQLNVESSGKLVFFDKSADEEGEIEVCCTTSSEEHPDTIQQSFQYAGLVNNIDSSQDIHYLEADVGTYTFNLTNCSFDNVDVYLVDNIQDIFHSDITSDDEETTYTLTPLTVPFEDTYMAEIPQSEPLHFLLDCSYSFQPVIYFEGQGTLIISDGDKILQKIEVSETGEYNNNPKIYADFVFEEGKTYFLDIIPLYQTSESYKCQFAVTDRENEF